MPLAGPDRGKLGGFVLIGMLATASGPGIAPAQPAQPALTPGVVAADHPLASWAGARILERGGNAVDAAVATSFALSVVRPESCGIAGGGFMVIHLRDDPRTAVIGDPVNIAIDYRERAPAAMTADHFAGLPEDASRHTGHAVAVPGTVAGLIYALETFGTMSPMEVIEPAISLARVGWIVDAYQHEAIVELAEHAGRNGQRYSAEEQRFIAALTTDGQPMPGELLTNPRQARALERIARHGAAGFYQGPVAEAIVETVRRHGGVMTLEDLAGVTPVVGEPIVRTMPGWGDRTIVTMPLPSSGGITLVQMLTMLDELRPTFDAAIDAGDGARSAHLIAEIMKHAFADRSAFMGDPEFTEVDVESLLDDAALRERARRIAMDRTLPPDWYGALGDARARDANNPASTPQTAPVPAAVPDDGGTSHFSVLDRHGNAVSCTETINLLFGSKIPVAEFGFFLNNQMDDFATRAGQPNAFGLIQSDRNAPEPRKRPLSSMTPTIVLGADGYVELVVGASGGPRIITAVFQTIVRCFVGGNENARVAVDAYRMHHQWQPDRLMLEPGTRQRVRSRELPIVPTETETRVWPIHAYTGIDLPFGFNHMLFAQLRARGHELGTIATAGVVQLIAVSGGEAMGFSDPRKGGLPAEAVD